jgi:hypothetical protein
MKLAGDFLKKFQSITPPHDSLKTAIVDVVYQITSKKISKRGVEIRNGVAFLSESSVFKNVLRVKRAEILTLLYETLPKSRESVRDIR